MGYYILKLGATLILLIYTVNIMINQLTRLTPLKTIVLAIAPYCPIILMLLIMNLILRRYNALSLYISTTIVGDIMDAVIICKITLLKNKK